MTGVYDFQNSVGVGARELLGIAGRHHIVMGSVEDERGLVEGGVVLVTGAVFQKSVGEASVPVVPIVKYFYGAAGAPLCHLIRAETFRPSAGEAEGWRQQHQATNL